MRRERHGHRSRPRGRSERPDLRRPVPRSRSGFIGRRWERTGTEPITAQSALGLRLVLAIVFTPLFIAAAVMFAVWSAHSGPRSTPTPTELAVLAGICAALALGALLDLVTVLRRRRRE